MSAGNRSTLLVVTASERSLMYTKNINGSRILPCGTPENTERTVENDNH